MIYILGFLVGLIIVVGQVLWKTGGEKIAQSMDLGTVTFMQAAKSIMSPYIILGIVLYVLATVAYIFLLSKYEYTNLQAIVVSSSLIMTFFAASTIFNESISIVNLIGLLLLVAGVILITKF